MTPDLQSILERIGWATVKARAPAYALQLEVRLRDSSRDNAARTAQVERERLECFIEDVLRVKGSADALAITSKSFVDFELSSSSERDGVIPNRTQDAVDLLLALGPGLEALAEFLDQRANHARGGRPRKDAAFRIAEAVAEIYVIGRGEMPAKSSSAEGLASGEFSNVCHEVFKALGVDSSRRTLEPLRAAIDRLTGERLDRLMAIRSGALSRDLPSLFDLAAKGKLDRKS